MSETQLFKAIGVVDEKYIVETIQPAAKRLHPHRIWIVAACLAALLALSLGAAAAVENGILFKKISSDTWEDGTTQIVYELEASVKEIPREEITGKVSEVKAIILEQIANYSIYSSSIPNLWDRYYDTSADALAYLGCARIQLPELGWQETRSKLEVMGDKNGDFQQIVLRVDYKHAGFRMQSSAEIFPDLDGAPDDLTIPILSLDQYRDSYTQGSYTTASGKKAIVVVATEDGGFTYIDGHIAVNDVLYKLHIIGNDQAKATALLHQWLDSF